LNENGPAFALFHTHPMKRPTPFANRNKLVALTPAAARTVVSTKIKPNLEVAGS
jgi:hypothetical protein